MADFECRFPYDRAPFWPFLGERFWGNIRRPLLLPAPLVYCWLFGPWFMSWCGHFSWIPASPAHSSPATRSKTGRTAQALQHKEEHTDYSLCQSDRGSRMGRWIRGRWICVFGAPRSSVQRPPNPYFKGFWSDLGQKSGVPKTQIQRARIQTSILGPPTLAAKSLLKPREYLWPIHNPTMCRPTKRTDAIVLLEILIFLHFARKYDVVCKSGLGHLSTHCSREEGNGALAMFTRDIFEASIRKGRTWAIAVEGFV